MDDGKSNPTLHPRYENEPKSPPVDIESYTFTRARFVETTLAALAKMRHWKNGLGLQKGMQTRERTTREAEKSDDGLCPFTTAFAKDSVVRTGQCFSRCYATRV